MSSFKGSYRYSVDSKGRINIPVKLRKSIVGESNESFVVTRGFEGCLAVYPYDEWKEVEKTIRALPTSEPHNRFFQRTLLDQATDVELDSQARIVVPRELLQFAGIENDVLIVGVLERIELWNPARYHDYMKSQKESYEDVAQRVLARK
jgi:MraZ protein